jgi:amino acid adenylation domain-containing protein
MALCYGKERLTYGELDRKADQFSAYLAGLGVSRGRTVAICMERSFDWIVAALATMRSGAAYVPLDSTWPDSRLRFTLSDCDASALIARAPLLDRLHPSVHGIDPCRDAHLIDAAPAVPRAPIDPNSLAYVIYTSGSTGVPKGVEITHANLNYLIRWHRSSFHVTRQDRASHISGLAFDVAVWEIWPNLAAGATLCLVEEEVRPIPDLLRQWLIRERITIAFAPTVLCSQLIAMEWPDDASLRLLLTGGDVLQRAPAKRIPFRVVNNYGPSECSVVATSTVVEPGTDDVPPIGRPIHGASIYLLNEEGSPVSDGQIGEVYIGGSGVGRGYRNLPSLTRERFLPDPFSEGQGSRIYRTGDRGRRRNDGQIEFHGRLDRQVKIRGHRVELDEIGTVLAAHPRIEYAAVVVRPSDSGDHELLAYVACTKDSAIPGAPDLQQHLRQSLPEHMVPQRFLLLDSIPLTSNGKIDYSRLETASGTDLFRNQDDELPRNSIEDKLLVLVREMLKNQNVRIDDNFFLAGGHSLIGMQLVLRIQDTFGVGVTLLQLLNAPTIRQLAAAIESSLVEDIRSMSEEEAARLVSD